MAESLAVNAANDSPYWPACTSDPAFLPWLSRLVTIAKNTQADTPTCELVRMAHKHGLVPPEWGLAALFIMEQARKG
jgi:hypothetical protein